MTIIANVKDLDELDTNSRYRITGVIGAKTLQEAFFRAYDGQRNEEYYQRTGVSISRADSLFHGYSSIWIPPQGITDQIDEQNLKAKFQSVLDAVTGRSTAICNLAIARTIVQAQDIARYEMSRQKPHLDNFNRGESTSDSRFYEPTAIRILISLKGPGPILYPQKEDLCEDDIEEDGSVKASSYHKLADPLQIPEGAGVIYNHYGPVKHRLVHEAPLVYSTESDPNAIVRELVAIDLILCAP